MSRFERFAIPTPFDVGRVNCYCFENGHLTVLDPGPATDDAYEELVAGLDRAGHAVADVERVLVTHPHMDHFGLARRLVEASGARVLAHGDAADHLADPEGYFAREQAFFEPYLVSMGVPEDVAEAVVGLPEAYTDFQEPVSVDRELADGDRVDVGFDLEAVHTPGHAPGSVCLVDREESVAFTGDHVLAEISPNPLLTLAPGSDDERTRSLPEYLTSLRKLWQTGATVGHPGHRRTIPDLPERIDEILEHHHRRKERIAEMVDDLGPTTAYRLMGELFPDLPATETFPGMSEVIGHLDLLEDEDRVEISESGGVRRYSLA